MRKKVCMLGSFAVGKTSLVRKFVSGLFSEQYLTTIGVKIDRRDVTVDGRDVSLVVWDLYGEDEFQKMRSSYLRGSSGYLLVVDVTRPDTLRTAASLHQLAVDAVGDVPFLVVLNKIDLTAERAMSEAEVVALRERGWTIVETSAKSGTGVGAAFEILARRMTTNDQDSNDTPGPRR